MSFSSVVTGKSPLLWWRLNETSGTNSADSSGNSHDGTDSPDGGVTHNVAGPAAETDGDTAVALDGVNGFVYSSDFAPSGEQTFIFVCKRTDTSAQMALMGADSNNVELYLEDGGEGVSWFPNTGDIGVVWSGAFPGTGVWAFLALHQNDSTGVADLWVGTVGGNDLANAGNQTGGPSYSSPGNLVVGSRYAVFAGDPFKGSVAEFIVLDGYNTTDISDIYDALSASEAPAITEWWTVT